MLKLELDPITGKAIIYGLTPKSIGATELTDLGPITEAIAALSERVSILESTAVTETSYVLELRPAQA